MKKILSVVALCVVGIATINAKNSVTVVNNTGGWVKVSVSHLNYEKTGRGKRLPFGSGKVVSFDEIAPTVSASKDLGDVGMLGVHSATVTFVHCPELDMPKGASQKDIMTAAAKVAISGACKQLQLNCSVESKKVSGDSHKIIVNGNEKGISCSVE